MHHENSPLESNEDPNKCRVIIQRISSEDTYAYINMEHGSEGYFISSYTFKKMRTLQLYIPS